MIEDTGANDVQTAAREGDAPPGADRPARGGNASAGAEAPSRDPVAVRVHLTPPALEEIREMLAEEGVEDEGGLRLTARTGAGCSAPLQYGMFLEEAPEPDDAVLTAQGVRIFLHPRDAWVLDGLLVDYVSSPHLGEGFAFRHPGRSGGPSC